MLLQSLFVLGAINEFKIASQAELGAPEVLSALHILLGNPLRVAPQNIVLDKLKVSFIVVHQLHEAVIFYLEVLVVQIEEDLLPVPLVVLSLLISPLFFEKP